MRSHSEVLKDLADAIGPVIDEWESDPMSVQCFDLRVVERVKAAVKAARMTLDPPPLTPEEALAFMGEVMDLAREFNSPKACTHPLTSLAHGYCTVCDYQVLDASEGAG